MPDCVSTGEREWTEPHWSYRGAAPRDVRGGAGAAAIASATYVFRRKFKLRYKCCTGADTRYVWVDGNYAYYVERAYDSSAFVVGHAAIGLPVQGLLAELAGALGADITIADWWIDDREVNAYKPGVEDLQEPNGRDALVAVPKADCGHKVTVGDATSLGVSLHVTTATGGMEERALILRPTIRRIQGRAGSRSGGSRGVGQRRWTNVVRTGIRSRL